MKMKVTAIVIALIVKGRGRNGVPVEVIKKLPSQSLCTFPRSRPNAG